MTLELKKEKYINPFTDFGFKRLFGEEINKDLLLDFLNELLHEQQGTITEVTYMKTEKFGRTDEERRAIFDIYCENDKGEKFLVEMQKSKQAFFKDRTVYYATFPIQEQAARSDWDYKLEHVYTVAVLDFVFDEDKNDTGKFRYDIKLTDNETNKVFYDKLTFVYLEMPKFAKEIHQLETRFDKWLYVLKNLHKLDQLPDNLKESVFEKVFKVAEIAAMTKEEFRTYEESLKTYRDLQNSIETARAEGEAKGKSEGKIEGKMESLEAMAVKMHAKGFPAAVISELTGLPLERIADLRSSPPTDGRIANRQRSQLFYTLNRSHNYLHK